MWFCPNILSVPQDGSFSAAVWQEHSEILKGEILPFWTTLIHVLNY